MTDEKRGTNSIHDIDVGYEDLVSYLKRCIKDGVCHARRYVIGHACPDADALISSMTWALSCELAENPDNKCGDVRVSLLLPAGTDRVPSEVAYLVGEEVAALLSALPTADDPAVVARLESGDASLILTDTSGAGPLSRYVTSILDHHPDQIDPAVKALPGEITVESVGATASLVCRGMRRLGFIPDKALARILAGAVIADTEGLSPAKVKDADLAAISFLDVDTCACKDIWSGFLEALLGETDPALLLARDYREEVTENGLAIGFAVVKCLEDRMPSLATLKAGATATVAEKGLALCLIKLCGYVPGDAPGEPSRWDSDRLTAVAGDPGAAERFLDRLGALLPGSVRESVDADVVADVVADVDVGIEALRLSVPMSRKKLWPLVLEVARSTDI